MSAIKVPELRAEEFRLWLANKNPRAIVGERNETRLCPMANWAHDDLGLANAEVSYSVWQPVVGIKNAFIDMPHWAEAFAIQIDDSGKPCSGVRASTALRVLDRVLAEQHERTDQ